MDTAAERKMPYIYPKGEDFTPSIRGTRATPDMEHYLVSRTFESEELTGGRVRVEEMRVVNGKPTQTGWHIHKTELHIFYVLKGELHIEFPGGVIDLKEGMCMRLPALMPHRETSIVPDTEMLEITVPARFETIHVPPPN